MEKKIFKYENKNNKRLRVKDLLMLFAIFAICIVSIIYAGIKANDNIHTVDNTAVNSGAESENSKEMLARTSQLGQRSGVKSDANIVIKAEQKFIVPVNGAVIKPYSRHELLYSETMDDWRIHNGIDLACEYGSNVFSSENGIVRSVKYDMNYGNTVSVECGDFELLYTSLSADIPVKEGQYVSKGEVIGKTSDTCMSEICDEPHIHFEMKKSGEYVDPLDYIHFE